MSEFNPTSERELYSQWKEWWEMYADFIEFGPDILYTGKYLLAHPRENSTDYNQRLARSDNYNILPEIVSIYASYQFGQLPSRTIEGKYKTQIEEFFQNCDGKGTSLDSFMQETAYTDMLTYGWTELMVDMPQVDDANLPITMQQEIDSGFLPYVTSKTPLSRINWGLDLNEAYNWVVFIESPIDSLVPSNASSDEPTYLLVTRDHWFRYGKLGGEDNQGTYTIIADGDIPFDMVPATPLFHAKSKKFKRWGISLFQESAPNSKAILNLLSQQQQDIFASFSFLAIQSDKELSSGANELGTSRIVTYSVESKNPPQYIVVPVEHIEAKQTIIEAKIEHILRKANLSVAIGKLSKELRSGIAGEVERRELYATLQAFSRKLEEAEEGIISWAVSWLAGEYVPPEETGFTVQYNDKFRLESTDELINLTEKVVDIYQGISDTYIRETLKLLPTKQFREGDDVVDTIYDEIDEADVSEMGLIPENSEKEVDDDE